MRVSRRDERFARNHEEALRNPTHGSALAGFREAIASADTPDKYDDLMRRYYPSGPPHTYIACDECGVAFADLVQLGSDPPDYDQSTLWLCRPCLLRAAELLP